MNTMAFEIMLAVGTIMHLMQINQQMHAQVTKG